ncbi:MAG TPA: SMC-Scp complex subunit ScpB [Terriglobia bacterium]|nr:SMC-Scp complex subunit ScpB [Terriglobia bacterium]
MADSTLTNETLKALIEAILYVSPEPVTLDMLAKALGGEGKDRIKGAVFELMNDYAWPQHGIQIRPVAGGWKFSSKAEHHEVLRSFVKSLKAPVRLSKPALEVLAAIAYRQPITVPEINEIRGVDCGGVIHTLMERKLIVTAGRKDVVGRPILYKTSREFMLHFGLRDLSELPSLREFEEMARQALGSEFLPSETLLPETETATAGRSGIGNESVTATTDDASALKDATAAPLEIQTSQKDRAASGALQPAAAPSSEQGAEVAFSTDESADSKESAKEPGD